MEIKNSVENLNRILDIAEDGIHLENRKADLTKVSECSKMCYRSGKCVGQVKRCEIMMRGTPVK